MDDIGYITFCQSNIWHWMSFKKTKIRHFFRESEEYQIERAIRIHHMQILWWISSIVRFEKWCRNQKHVPRRHIEIVMIDKYWIYATYKYCEWHLEKNPQTGILCVIFIDHIHHLFIFKNAGFSTITTLIRYTILKADLKTIKIVIRCNTKANLTTLAPHGAFDNVRAQTVDIYL